jgi:hypothetical protein
MSRTQDICGGTSVNCWFAQWCPQGRRQEHFRKHASCTDDLLFDALRRPDILKKILISSPQRCFIFPSGCWGFTAYSRREAISNGNIANANANNSAWKFRL